GDRLEAASPATGGIGDNARPPAPRWGNFAPRSAPAFRKPGSTDDIVWLRDATSGELMTSPEPPVDQINVGDPELWENGPPTELFARLRAACPGHWCGPSGLSDMPGLWSVTRAGHIAAICRSWNSW